MSEIAEEIRNGIEHITPEWWRAYQNQLQQIGDEEGIYVFIRKEDAPLFIHVPIWLRTLLEANELLRQSKADAEHNRKLLSKEKQELIEENERLKENLSFDKQMYDQVYDDRERLRDELDQAKKERDELLGIVEFWLERSSVASHREKFRSILKRYKEGDTE